MSKKSHEPQAVYVTRRPMPDFGTALTPFTPLNFYDFEMAEIARLQEEIRLLRAALEALTRPLDVQGETGTQKSISTIPVSDFVPICKHRFDYFAARYTWLVFRCVHCGKQFTPDEICRMLNEGRLAEGAE